MNKYEELWDVVVNDCYCIWGMFLENVRAEGWTIQRLKTEAEKCLDRKALQSLASKFI